MESVQTGRCIREMQAQLGRLPEWFEYFGAVCRTHEGQNLPFLVRTIMDLFVEYSIAYRG